MRQNSSLEGTSATIGTLSKRTGCKIETIRYYERIGLLPSPLRTEGGYRLYDEVQVKRLTFIRRSRELGFTLQEVRELLGLVDGEHYSCDEVQARTLDHLADIKQKMADLRKLERVLKNMVAQCTGGKLPECPIIDALFDSGVQT
jgi:MerR family mercuric resistance operon transcriptional regulator